MKNNKYKKALALILSALLVMPCHATKPQYTHNPNTGLRVQRGEPSPEDTQHRERLRHTNTRNYGTIFRCILTLFGVGAIATVHHNNTGDKIDFNRCDYLVKNYHLPADSLNYVRLNKLRVYVHKDLCTHFDSQRPLFVARVENNILPNIRRGDFIPCATHIYLNNECILDDEFKDADYKLISDDSLKIFALRCIFGVNGPDALPDYTPQTGSTGSINGTNPPCPDLDKAIASLDSFIKGFNDQMSALHSAFRSLSSPPPLPKSSSQLPSDPTAASTAPKDTVNAETGAAVPKPNDSPTDCLLEQLDAQPNPFAAYSALLLRLKWWSVACDNALHNSNALEILHCRHTSSAVPSADSLRRLNASVNKVLSARAFCSALISSCNACIARFSTASSPTSY